MMIITRQNNKVHYAYQQPSNTNTHSSSKSKCKLLPLPLVNRTPIRQVSIHKWYIVNRDVVDHIIDKYIETFYDFLDRTPRYNVYLDEYEFRECMIRKIYNSSQNKNKNLI